MIHARISEKFSGMVWPIEAKMWNMALSVAGLGEGWRLTKRNTFEGKPTKCSISLQWKIIAFVTSSLTYCYKKTTKKDSSFFY